jgi:hypothetical protein
MAIAIDTAPPVSAGTRALKPPVWRLLHATLRIYGRRWRPHLTASIIAQGPVLLPMVFLLDRLTESMAAAGASAEPDPRAVALSILVLLLGFASAFLFVLMTGAASQLVEFWLEHRLVSIIAAYRVAFRHFWRLALTMLVVFTILCVGIAVLVVAFAVASTNVGGAGSSTQDGKPLGLLLASLGAIVLVCALMVDALVRWAVFVQAVIIEGFGPVGALRRSAMLVKGRWRRTGLIMGIFVVLPLLATMAIGAAGSLVLSPLRGPGGVSSGLPGAIAGVVAQLAISPLPAIGVTVLFYALRDGDSAWSRIDARMESEKLVP